MRTNFSLWAIALGACVLVSLTQVVIGDDRGGNRFQLRLNGFQENPSISTTGRGRLDLRIDEDAEEIHYRLRYSDLEGTAPVNGTPGTVLFAHIHLGAVHTNGGVVAFLCGGGGKPACPPAPADVEGVIMPADIVGPAAQGINAGEETAFAEFLRAIRAGYTYANVHTTRWPTGEIRDQVGNRDDGGGRGGHDHD